MGRPSLLSKANSSIASIKTTEVASRFSVLKRPPPTINPFIQARDEVVDQSNVCITSENEDDAGTDERRTQDRSVHRCSQIKKYSAELFSPSKKRR